MTSTSTLSRWLAAPPRHRDELLVGPISGELLGPEHLVERARALAGRQRHVPRPAHRGKTPLLARLRQSLSILDESYERLTDAARREVDVAPAGEWLLDNYHVIQEHIREVRNSLPRDYYRELPELASGPLAGYPRVYELAITLISHTEGRIDLENVQLFVGAFQEVAPLSLGELWAIPAMLRLGLIENVRRMSLRTVQRLHEVELADGWAMRIESARDAGDRSLSAALEEFVANPPNLTPIFVSRFLQRLRQLPKTLEPLVWLTEWIAEDGVSADQAAVRSAERLAITQVIMANNITSLRAMSRMDWRLFVESQSHVDAVLREDPTGHYARMVFSTRDQYRHVVERLAKRTNTREDVVARRAIDLARAQSPNGPNPERRRHVGYFLVDGGLAELERSVGYRASPTEALHRWALLHPNVVFVGGITLVTLAALAAVIWLSGADRAWVRLAILLLAFLPAVDIAVSVVNMLVTAILPPRVLPKLDLDESVGIPPELRTAVVVPTLLPTVQSVHEALEHLEVQFLANRQANLHFALLTDFTDAPTETTALDEEIVTAAAQGIAALNERYAPQQPNAFYLFHRPRRWNPKQAVWMGWERKRGKLADFNHFARGEASDAFSHVVGDVESIRKIRFVITLDADTVLPPDAALLLIGTLAHPLNRAVHDDAVGRVVAGYGILQPRVGVSLGSAHRSRFASIQSGHPGVDPYTTAVSDVYQDLFGEGSFTGKGIYDLDAFERATNGRFPENTLLSHDLIEGNYARAGLVTDITLYDDYPATYQSYSRRKHRWIRGDWQLLRWLTDWVPGPQGLEPNRLSLLSRWKLLDNLRRSLTEPSQLAFFILGWALLPVSPIRWTLLGLGSLAAPWIVALVMAALRPPLDKSWRAYYAGVARDAVTSAKQVALVILFLPHQAWLSLDAIGRTLWRLRVSGRSLLEWQAASQVERTAATSGGALWRAMLPSVVTVAVLVAAAVAWRLTMLSDVSPWLIALAVVPLALVWVSAPTVAHVLSAPAISVERRLSGEDRADALRYALFHWRYFERFVSEQTQWLAPDNFQDDPAPVITMRTSPTNIGLQLLATVSAYDLGFLSARRAVQYLTNVFRSLERMRRFRGHFYNWYDLHDLRVLDPAYISTVDSGNLAGHLLAVRQACLGMIEDRVFDRRTWHALDIALGLSSERLHDIASSGEAGTPESWRAVRDAATVVAAIRRTVSTPAAQTVPVAALQQVGARLATVQESIHGAGLPESAAASALEWVDWSARLITEHRDRVATLPTTTIEGRDGEQITEFPSHRDLAGDDPEAERLIAQLEAIAARAYDLVMEMDFAFLFDPRRRLFAIGFQQSTHSLDVSDYDLLASEARLASFIAIAKDDVPVEHWHRLGRTLTHAGGETALVSWSGSMFEYLMPLLVMQTFPFTLLDQTYGSAVRRQISYGAERGVPWGASESAYNLRDRHLIYQYRAFGVPDLALKRGLGRDLVIAPYASALAAMVDAERALRNLRTFEGMGLLGPFGFRDAVDYTRPEPNRPYAVVHNYMAHHIGMSLVALTNVLAGRQWQRRFHADPMVRATELLLHERIPRRLVMQEAQESSAKDSLPDPELERPAVREAQTPDLPQPQVALLGRLPYTIMVTSGGGGYSRYEKLAVTRWRADGTADSTGQFCYVKDLDTGRAWSVAHQPVGAEADWYRVQLATDRVTFHRADGDIETRTEIAAVPEDSAEVRRVIVTNNGSKRREIELTSYGEIVLAPPEDDRVHPTFGNLFVETEWHDWCTALTATRRPRSESERSLWCVHVVATGPERTAPSTFDSDRSRFLGRGRTTRYPIALENDGPLTGSSGAVLDPIFAIRARVSVEPGRSATVAFTTLVTEDRQRAFELAGRYHDLHAAQRALDLAWTSAQVELRELATTPIDAAIFQDLAGHLLYPHPGIRAPAAELLANRAPQPLLWAQGLSGDWPIVLAVIDSSDGLPTLRHLLAAHRYWQRRGMTVDLVILDARAEGYMLELSERITQALTAAGSSGMADVPGGVFVRRAELLNAEELRMLRALARVHVHCDGRSLGRLLVAMAPDSGEGVEPDESGVIELRMSGRITPPNTRSLGRTLGKAARGAARLGLRAAGKPDTHRHHTTPAVPDRGLLFDSGYGGLADDGAYEIRVRGDRVPPAPWINVIASVRGGVLVSERGAGCTWADSSYFFRLTPWHNDPVSDPPADVLYLQDADSGALWSATPAPCGGMIPYRIRHAPGISTFAHQTDELAVELSIGIAEHEPVRISVLRVTNTGDRQRRLTLTSYAEWTLGVLREHTQHHVQTHYEPGYGAVFARNYFDPQFAGHVAFSAISEPVLAHTADRRSFLGRNGALRDPEGLREPLNGQAGAGLDPCAALQCTMVLAPGETREVTALLGAAENGDAARAIVAEYRDPSSARAAMDQTVRAWDLRLSTITVRTPEPSFDAMLNRWTMYQALSCRMWARSATYQSSGAFGFRDQLQDCMAFVYSEPALAREHILRAASRQFIEGDVQHWWHPQTGRGVRTRFSDDLAWLPFVVDHYVSVTGDGSVLDERVPFLRMRPLEPHEHEVYDAPEIADESATVYEHCLRALRRACTVGAHGLPLIGSGDWNDGMNRVGIEGRGESVWLAWFLIATARAFALHSELRGDAAAADELRTRADAYSSAVELHGWDGEWYRRAYFDDGTPLGSRVSDECRIDSIAQSWSVISGAGDPARQAQAMESLERHLVRSDARLLMLLTPPFD
ncbi:MAG TPA: glucoamylase family protein, partial [Gemmatimonadaceae bacterium]|nr:glucoamylase family protein [Gemmatimonadaceae bacterium]